MSSSSTAGFYSAEEMEERNRMFRDYYRSLISISPSPPLPESPEPAPETAQSPLPLAEEGEESFDLRAEYVLLSGRLQTTERNLEMMGLEYDELLESVMQRTTEVVEKDEVIATLSAKMREAEKKAKEDVARERKINIGLAQGITNLGADLGALRRVLPIAYGHIQTVQCREHELLQEELIIAYLLRNEVDRSFIEIFEGHEVQLSIVLDGGQKMRKCWLRTSSHGLYRAWSEEEGASWKEDRMRVYFYFGNLTVTNYAERLPLPADLECVLRRSSIQRAVFNGFSGMTDFRRWLSLNGVNCPY